ncbi:patatin-like phospholipase family protein [Phenylobacterium sp.]|jgi:NTE family protein|uniref:patatin-like phospholipase family protein n=1 Tax=Phenylobacterium sp. TaxID=1871053 RepID=UPI002E352E9C|nr:patatin-like phospholipase family protein [Phenylobacterium sp.]HEX2561205.1 patatin-like phospholipase family protein [Phenylobacterium sp.]
MTTRALVLGGGGPVGIAWECGLIAGLHAAGVNLGEADFIMGTSAGSFVGARLAMGAEPKSLAAPILAEAERPQRAAPANGSAPERPADTSALMQMLSGEGTAGLSPQETMQRIGAFALNARTMNEDAFIGTFGKSFASLPDDAWPPKDYACTAVDAESGEFRLWTKESGVGVTRAVASSCSVPGIYPPVTIQGRRYMDGGMRSGTNADLAKGHDKVLIIALRIGGTGPAAERAAKRLASEVEALTASGARVEVITPDEASQSAFGPNLMDFRRRPDAARGGMAQGEREAERIGGFWS